MKGKKTLWVKINSILALLFGFKEKDVNAPYRLVNFHGKQKYTLKLHVWGFVFAEQLKNKRRNDLFFRHFGNFDEIYEV